MSRLLPVLCLTLLTVAVGCGKTVNHSATEQLILSDAADKAIRTIDFSPLAGRSCYIDTTYITTVKSTTFSNSDYVLSSMRNQMLAAGCRIVKTAPESDIVIEPRIGALGIDNHEVSYGVPSNNLISQAASVMTTPVPVPSIPEISLARKDNQVAAAKLAVFAYDTRSGMPVWQSGISLARSTAKDSYFFGVGPIQSGEIYQRPRFAGRRLRLPLAGDTDNDRHRQAVSLDEEFVFYEDPAPTTAFNSPVPPPAVPPAEVPPESSTVNLLETTAKTPPPDDRASTGSTPPVTPAVTPPVTDSAADLPPLPPTEVPTGAVSRK